MKIHNTWFHIILYLTEDDLYKLCKINKDK